MAREHRKLHVSSQQIPLASETFSLHPQAWMHCQAHRVPAKDPKSHTILHVVLCTYLTFPDYYCICSLASTALTHESGSLNSFRTESRDGKYQAQESLSGNHTHPPRCCSKVAWFPLPLRRETWMESSPPYIVHSFLSFLPTKHAWQLWWPTNTL